MTYENLNRNIKDDTNEAIMKLRSEVSKQYGEINDMFQRLRGEIKEASQLKFEADRELNKIKDEIERKKITAIIFEEKFNEVLERHAPHNNLHIPISETNPLYFNNKTNRQHNLKSTSTMIYNKDELNGERPDLETKISSLAQRGKTLIADTEFVPIVEPSKKFEKYREEEFKDYRDLKPVYNNPNLNANATTFNRNPIIVNDQPADFNDMFSKLNEIVEINSKIDPTSRYKEVGKNFESDINNKYKETKWENYENNSNINKNRMQGNDFSNDNRNNSNFNPTNINNFDTTEINEIVDLDDIPEL